MRRFFISFATIVFLLALFGVAYSQVVETDAERNFGQISGDFLGVKLRPEVQEIVKEIERKTDSKIYARFGELEAFMLGASFISEDDGVAVVYVDYKLEGGDAKKLEAVITHELLHLRLTATGFPAFIFSETVNTSKGRAIDTEQSNINDLRSMIEHRIFKAEMEKFDLHKYVDLAGDITDSARKNKRKEDSQADSINYARAILEYQIAADIEEVRKVFAANKWTRALRDGKAIADIIAASNLKTAKDSETVFLKCLAVLYPMPNSQYYFKLTTDPKIKTFKRMIVSIVKKAATRRKGAKRN